MTIVEIIVPEETRTTTNSDGRTSTYKFMQYKDENGMVNNLTIFGEK